MHLLQQGQTRPRNNGKMTSSNSSQIHHKTGTTSPLSQSTSAVHLQEEVVAPAISRSQSKRKLGFRRTLFGGSNNAGNLVVPKDTDNADTTNRRLSIANDGVLVKRKGSKRAPQVPHSISGGTASSYPIQELSSLPSYVPENKGKRMSMFNRLTRRFSILRRPTIPFDISEDKQLTLVDADSKSSSPLETKDTLESLEKPSEEMRRKSPNLAKRIPPPSLNDESNPDIVVANADVAGKRSSESISVEPPYKGGKLTIANPDVESKAAKSNTSSVIVHTNLDGLEKKIENIVKEDVKDTSAHGNGLAQGNDKLETLLVSPTESHPPLVPEKDDKDEVVKEVSVNATEDVTPTDEQPLEPPPLKLFAEVRDNSDSTSADHSPVSKASILANPPTPHLPSITMPPSLNPSLNADVTEKDKPSQEVVRELPQENLQLKQEDESQNKNSRKDKFKQPVTETFKLVRSSSEKARRNSQVVTVGEEQWELVEVPEAERKRRSSKDKDRSKSKEAERSSRRDSNKRHERSQSDVRADQEKASPPYLAR